MKLFLAYWIIGCIFIGEGFAMYINKCPNDSHQLPIIDVVGTVAVWPLTLVVSLDTKKSEIVCKIVP